MKEPKGKKDVKKEEFATAGSKAALLMFILIIGILLGALGQKYFGFFKEITPTKIEKRTFEGEEGVTYIKVPAVDNTGEGVATTLAVRVEEGTGKTLVDIDSLLFWVDTQNSIRMAKLVAENITGVDTSKVDLTYSIDANASLIGGESAGTALTIATIAALENQNLNNDVMITGTVNHDGSIGPVGGVLEKAKAAKSSGATILLVPLLESREITYVENEHCEKFGLLEWCTTERIPVQVDVAKESGIEVIEVGTVKEAYSYFVITENR